MMSPLETNVVKTSKKNPKEITRNHQNDVSSSLKVDPTPQHSPGSGEQAGDRTPANHVPVRKPAERDPPVRTGSQWKMEWCSAQAV